ncbi:cyclase family protein [Lujinxingia vulgaris]|uniref:Cyclase family protein n=1 Tax=Lujinxingia vulgaris TaxID=2600176 RepID=A0A5C6X3X7_9DELT|nr:cyclase family protein [Lujinxingia vulgaris]TXD35817.1 cyclase family protein [Lujinxingia vulgaris]
MRLWVELDGARYAVAADHPLELAQPLDFYGEQPRAFGLGRAQARAVEGGDFVGDVRRGGSVNCESIELIAHGHGTHTEGVGHISAERVPVGDLAPDPLMPAVLLRVATRTLGASGDSSEGKSSPDDRVICTSELRSALQRADVSPAFCRAIIIATSGEGAAAPLRDYSGTNPAYLTAEAVTWLLAQGCEHLLIDLPSIDREDDGGTTPVHRAYFELSAVGAGPTDAGPRRTITELIDVPESASEGPYFLSLRFARFMLDASPSRPILYRAEPMPETR